MQYRLLCLLALGSVTALGCDAASHGSNDPNQNTGDAAAGAQLDAGDSDSGAGGSDAGVPHDGGSHPDADNPNDEGDAGDRTLDALESLASLSDFTRLATPSNEVKFLLSASDTDRAWSGTPDCVFQNTEAYPYHIQYLRTLPGLEQLSTKRYEEWVLWRASRKLYAGVLKLHTTARHPGSERLGVLGYSVYAAATVDERFDLDELSAIHSRLGQCAASLQELLAYVPQTPAELKWAEQHVDELEQAGIHFVAPSQLAPASGADIYSAGEAYGYLNFIDQPRELDDVGPRDVVLIDAAPNDLGLAAALLTRQPQSAVSHLNLRLREKAIPNAASEALFDAPALRQLEGQLVHLLAKDDGVSIEPARDEDALAFWKAREVRLETPDANLEVQELPALASLSNQDSLAYGTKAANLGELIRALESNNVVSGIAIPFAAYAEHVEHAAVAERIDALLAAELQAGPVLRGALDRLRDEIKEAPIPEAWEAAIHDAIHRHWGEQGFYTRLRFRSSTNVEDLPNWSGAGLYDSASGCIADDLDDDDEGPSLCLTDEQRRYYESELEHYRAALEADPTAAHLVEAVEDLEKELTREKSARKAVRKVWASLWNDRAFEDRQYYGLDHRGVFMGIAVHPAFVGEQLEAVVITHLEPEGDGPYYHVTSQAGEVGVVRPSDPSAVAEQLRFRRSSADQATDVTLIHPSSLTPGGGSLWSESQLEQLAAALFTVQDHFATHVYPDIEPLQLDVEVDVNAEGQVVLKQARPYHSQL